MCSEEGVLHMMVPQEEGFLGEAGFEDWVSDVIGEECGTISKDEASGECGRVEVVI